MDRVIKVINSFHYEIVYTDGVFHKGGAILLPISTPGIDQAISLVIL